MGRSDIWCLAISTLWQSRCNTSQMYVAFAFYASLSFFEWIGSKLARKAWPTSKNQSKFDTKILCFLLKENFEPWRLEPYSHFWCKLYIPEYVWVGIRDLWRFILPSFLIAHLNQFTKGNFLQKLSKWAILPIAWNLLDFFRNGLIKGFSGHYRMR